MTLKPTGSLIATSRFLVSPAPVHHRLERYGLPLVCLCCLSGVLVVRG